MKIKRFIFIVSLILAVIPTLSFPALAVVTSTSIGLGGSTTTSVGSSTATGSATSTSVGSGSGTGSATSTSVGSDTGTSDSGAATGGWYFVNQVLLGVNIFGNTYVNTPYKDSKGNYWTGY